MATRPPWSTIGRSREYIPHVTSVSLPQYDSLDSSRPTILSNDSPERRVSSGPWLPPARVFTALPASHVPPPRLQGKPPPLNNSSMQTIPKSVGHMKTVSAPHVGRPLAPLGQWSLNIASTTESKAAPQYKPQKQYSLRPSQPRAMARKMPSNELLNWFIQPPVYTPLPGEMSPLPLMYLQESEAESSYHESSRKRESNPRDVENIPNLLEMRNVEKPRTIFSALPHPVCSQESSLSTKYLAEAVTSHIDDLDPRTTRLERDVTSLLKDAGEVCPKSEISVRKSPLADISRPLVMGHDSPLGVKGTNMDILTNFTADLACGGLAQPCYIGSISSSSPNTIRRLHPIHQPLAKRNTLGTRVPMHEHGRTFKRADEEEILPTTVDTCESGEFTEPDSSSSGDTLDKKHDQTHSLTDDVIEETAPPQSHELYESGLFGGGNEELLHRIMDRLETVDRKLDRIESFLHQRAEVDSPKDGSDL